MTTSIQSKRVEFAGKAQLIYFSNYIVRNVVAVKTIGHIHDGRGGVRSWLNRNSFKSIFDLSSDQLSKIDLRRFSELHPDAVIAHDPFKGLEFEEIETALGILDLATNVVIAAIPSGEYHEVPPKVPLTVNALTKTLSQIGSVIQVYHCSYYSLFMVTK